ncbi:MAG: DUF4388 domain-containing protein, partial [Myxococcota bacterium]
RRLESQASEIIDASSRPPSNQESSGDSDTGLQGRLQQVGLSALLTLLEMERKSGVLMVKDDVQSARLSLRDGRVIGATTEGGEVRPVNAECVYYLLNWTAGRFEFTQSEVTDEDQIRLSTTRLLLEGAKRIDDLNEAARSGDGDEVDSLGEPPDDDDPDRI